MSFISLIIKTWQGPLGERARIEDLFWPPSLQPGRGGSLTDARSAPSRVHSGNHQLSFGLKQENCLSVSCPFPAESSRFWVCERGQVPKQFTPSRALRQAHHSSNPRKAPPLRSIRGALLKCMAKGKDRLSHQSLYAHVPFLSEAISSH